MNAQETEAVNFAITAIGKCLPQLPADEFEQADYARYMLQKLDATPAITAGKVPLTPTEAMTMVLDTPSPVTLAMCGSEAILALVRAVERYHKIGV
jgi:hypothetical protein